MAILRITSENFEEEVINSKVPVLIDFWAGWCMPCKMMAPVLEEIEKDVENNVKIGKINIDEELELATKFGVMSIPTFIVFHDGQVADRTVGVQEKENLMKLLK